jgi:hypothetical protein
MAVAVVARLSAPAAPAVLAQSVSYGLKKIYSRHLVVFPVIGNHLLVRLSQRLVFTKYWTALSPRIRKSMMFGGMYGH